MNRWRRFLRLAPAERHLLLQAFLFLPVTGLGLQLFGYQRWKSVVAPGDDRRRPAADPPTESSIEYAKAAARMVEAAARHGVYRATCLPRSVTLWWMLHRRGIRSDLRIGVRRRSEERFEAHAWVELAGRVLNDSEDIQEQFTPLKGQAEIPTPARFL